MAESILSQNEVDALLEGISTSGDDKLYDGEVRDFNLAEQQYIGRGRLPTLELINERFTRLLRIGLFNFLRRSSEVSSGAIKVTEYGEFLKTLAQPTHQCVHQSMNGHFGASKHDLVAFWIGAHR